MTTAKRLSILAKTGMWEEFGALCDGVDLRNDSDIDCMTTQQKLIARDCGAIIFFTPEEQVNYSSHDRTQYAHAWMFAISGYSKAIKERREEQDEG